MLLSSNSQTATIQLSTGRDGSDNRQETETDEEEKSEKEAADETREKSAHMRSSNRQTKREKGVA